MLRSGAVFDLTVQSIAKEVGVSRVTVYKYFPTVRDILKALSEEKIGLIFSNLPDVAGTERRYLEEFVSLALKVFLDDSHLVRNLVLEAPRVSRRQTAADERSHGNGCPASAVESSRCPRSLLGGAELLDRYPLRTAVSVQPVRTRAIQCAPVQPERPCPCSRWDDG